MKKYILILGEEACSPRILDYDEKKIRDNLYNEYKKNPSDYNLASGLTVKFNYIVKAEVSEFRRF